jgi:hypothetical protein
MMAEIWLRICTFVGVHDYLDLFSLGLVSREWYAYATDDLVWYGVYRSVFTNTLLHYTHLHPKDWMAVFRQHASLRVRWHKVHIQDKTPWTLVYALGDTYPLTTTIKASIKNNESHLDTSLALMLVDAHNERQATVITLDTTNWHTLHRFSLYNLKDIFVPDGIDMEQGLVYSLMYLHVPDKYLNALWFYWYKSEQQATLTIKALTRHTAHPMEAIVGAYMYPHGQGCYRVLGRQPFTGMVVLLSVQLSPTGEWDPHATTCTLVGDGVRARKCFMISDEHDLIFVHPMENLLHVHIYAIHHLQSPIAILEGMVDYDFSRDGMSLEEIKHDNFHYDKKPRLVQALLQHGIYSWELPNTVDAPDTPLRLQPSFKHVFSSNQEDTYVDCHQWLIFLVQEDKYTLVLDVSGAGQVEYSDNHHKWRIRSSGAKEPFVVAKLPPPKHSRTVRTVSRPSYNYFLKSRKVQRLNLDSK